MYLNASTILIKFTFSTFFRSIFYAFVVSDNNFCFFEHAIELIHVQIHLTSFTEFTIILSQT